MATSKPQSGGVPQNLSYDETLMYGQYRKDLASYARREAKRAKQRKTEPAYDFKTYSKEGRWHNFMDQCCWVKDTIVTKIGEDWVFLTLLGITMALVSFSMDYVISKFQTARIWVFYESENSVVLQYAVWVMFPMVFICFSTVFVHLVGPNAIGSGIPEMKTIMRGVILKEYLTMRTFIAKVVGLVTSLGCGMPIGKEGPFVHVASICATQLGKLIKSFRGIYENESRNTEMLAAACAVGVACTFAAPIGGVLFSIEVTATYFAVRNYWRGFYSAVIAALLFRFLAIWFEDEETLTAYLRTTLRDEIPFQPTEIIFFSILGVVCGFAGALFVFLHRKLVEFIRRQKAFSQFMQKKRVMFPGLIVIIITAFTFPPGLGQYMAGQLTNHEAVNQLFSNFTWAHGEAGNIDEERILNNWRGPANNIFLTISLFTVMRFWMTILATTLPVPAGVFMPVFTIGAAFGRLMGEGMAVWFPEGIDGHTVVPGGYAIVGAAALAGSVTHTVSTAVIVFELTGQMQHILPCVVAVLISNAIAHTLQPSMYDSIILIKKLPYLPDIISPRAVNAHRVFVEDFMVRNLHVLTSDSTYRDAAALLQRYKYKAFPLVDTIEKQILLGSVTRLELQRVIDDQLSRERRVHYFNSIKVAYAKGAGARSLESEEEDDDVEMQKDIDILEMLKKRPAIPTKKSNKQSPSAGKRGTDSGEKKTSRFSVSSVHKYNPSNNREPTPLLKPEDSSTQQSQEQSGAGPKKSILKNRGAGVAGDGGEQGLAGTAATLERDRVTFQAPVHEYEITEEEERSWEKRQMELRINYSTVRIDPAPFQLVERTSLYKVHSMFSLLGLNHAYVVNMGQLVGMVSLQEVRNAIEGQLMPTLELPVPKADLDDNDNDGKKVTASDHKVANAGGDVVQLNEIAGDSRLGGTSMA